MGGIGQGQSSSLATTRRAALAGLAGTLAVGVRPVRAAGAEVKVGVLMPTSGPWARPGTLYVKGAELAAAHINAQGGFRATGGNVKLIVYDVGDSPETARNAAQRMIAQEPDLSAAAGCWLSSFTLPVSDVTERAGLALVTGSSADQITSRGYRYVFRTVPSGEAWVRKLVPGIIGASMQANGRPPATASLVTDSTPAAVNWADVLRKDTLPKLGIKLVSDDTFTPPISDTTALVQKVRRARPELFINIATNVPDSKLFLDKMAELNVRVPTVFVANAMASSEVPALVSPKVLEAAMVAVNNWGSPDRQQIVDDFVKQSGEPFMAQESSNAYADMWLIKEAVERAGSAERGKVAEALRTLDIPTTEGIGKLYFGGRLQFDKDGNRVDAGMMLLQWQGGKLVIVFPTEMAGGATPIWPK